MDAEIDTPLPAKNVGVDPLIACVVNDPDNFNSNLPELSVFNTEF
jgi:hypothetical protein